MVLIRSSEHSTELVGHRRRSSLIGSIMLELRLRYASTSNKKLLKRLRIFKRSLMLNDASIASLKSNLSNS